MNLIEQIKQAFNTHLKKLFNLDDQTLINCSFELNVDPAKQQFGDISSNAAMVLAKELGRSPREIAQQIVNSFSNEQIETVQIAGPGFLNLYLKHS